MILDALLLTYLNLIYYDDAALLPQNVDQCGANCIQFSGYVDLNALENARKQGRYVLIVSANLMNRQFVDTLNSKAKNHFIGLIDGQTAYCDDLMNELQAIAAQNSVKDASGRAHVIRNSDFLPGIATTTDGDLVLTTFKPAGTAWMLDSKTIEPVPGATGTEHVLLSPDIFSEYDMLEAESVQELTLEEKLRFIRYAMMGDAAQDPPEYPSVSSEKRIVFFGNGAYLAESSCRGETFPNPEDFVYRVLFGENNGNDATRMIELTMNFLDEVDVSQGFLADLERAFLLGEEQSPAFWAAVMARELASAVPQPQNNE